MTQQCMLLNGEDVLLLACGDDKNEIDMATACALHVLLKNQSAVVADERVWSKSCEG